MLTAEGCAARRKRLWDALGDRADRLILADPKSLIYFANYAPSPFVFRSCDATAVLILEPDRATLVADGMVKVFLDQAHVDEIVDPVWYDGKHSAPHRIEQVVKTAVDRLKSEGVSKRSFAVETASVPGGITEGLRSSGGSIVSIPLDQLVRRLRRVKDADEIALIRRSVTAGEAGHAAALKLFKPGITEHAAFEIVQQAATAAAGEPVLIYGDFVSGPRCATDRGGPPSARVIEPGDLFILDYSVVVHGYRADFTNTFAVGAPPTSAQRDLFAVCVESLALAQASLKPGVAARDVDRAARGHAASKALGHAYLSHTGHGLGLSHPEPPYLVAESDETVVVGDVVAVEPGLYITGVGGMRFEHNYLNTSEGYETLTHHRITLEP